MNSPQEMALRGGGRKKKSRQHHYQHRRVSRSDAPSPTDAREVNGVDRDIQKLSRGRQRAADFASLAGERIVSVPVTIDGLVFRELGPLLRILPSGEIGLSRPDEQRMRWDRSQNPPVKVPNLRFTEHDITSLKTKITGARETDAYTIRNLKWIESQFKKNGGALEDFATYKKSLQYPLEGHYNRLMAYLKQREATKEERENRQDTSRGHSTAKMGTMGVEDCGDVEEDGDGSWPGNQLLKLLEQR